MKVERYERIRHAAAGGAEPLLRSGLEHSLPWLEAEEGRVAPFQNYLLARGRDGTPTALATCYPIRHTSAHRAYAAWEVLLGAPTEALVEALPPGAAHDDAVNTLAKLRAGLPATATDALAVVTPGSVRPGVLTARDAVPVRELDALVSAVEDLSAELSLPVVEFAHVRGDAEGRRLHRVLRARGYTAVTTGADAVLDARFTSLETYFARFRSNRRKTLRKERSRFLAQAPEVRLQGPEGLTPCLVALQLARYRAYGHDTDADAVRDRFSRAARIPGLKVLRADGSDGPLGFVAFYEDPRARRLVPRLGAFTRDVPSCYFNLSYYELIAYAARIGGMSIHYGDSTYGAKTLRGCRLVRLTTYLRAADPALHHQLDEAARLRTTLEENQMRAAEDMAGS
ncbi:hypothetical protein CP973_19355 [Streptomyces albofaciens JCM 4342]|uniref:peptidogalycan biosysnthesis protein n=1 Tax=Streptomyces albofaciens TaxID=66866 RepID=UPI00123C602E|nr:peptidogalycan biosysnthesis protein [Streptomyces albofaciens]KAA6223790.1 hypothetical protein CP973_19355 [Streptomyces albofaciens JCM 4342]